VQVQIETAAQAEFRSTGHRFRPEAARTVTRTATKQATMATMHAKSTRMTRPMMQAAAKSRLRSGPERRLRRRFPVAAAVALALAAAGLARPALAQQVAVIVNGAPITTYDIEQRSKFNTLSTHKTPDRQAIIEELIDEKLKVQAGQRYKLEVSDGEVDNAYANMARKMRLTPEQLTGALSHAGVDAQTLKARIRADIAWQQIVRGKFQSSLQVRDKDVKDKLASANKDEKKEVGYEYLLRPILFIVPPGAPEQVIDSRKREAEGLRVRFDNCETGLKFAGALRDVAVRDQIVKSSADLPPAMRKILDDVTVGKLTSPDVTPQGIQMFALCAKRENQVDSTASKEAREEMFLQQFQAKSKRYLEELRRGSMIEVK
jgi:peptidyl-prolyl cis-trans isomerase SurA